MADTSNAGDGNVLTIGTHNGTFHCDEVTACFLLKQLPKFKDAVVKRTRDQKLLDACDVVVDVGGVYDPRLNRYDHHQRDFKETFNSIRPEKPWTIKLSSAGLVYCHFGEQVLAQMTGLPVDDQFVQRVYDLMYENFIMEIDAIDNGVSACSSPTYQVHTGLSSRVGHLNPWWNETEPRPEDELFKEAVKLVGAEFSDRLQFYQRCWWPARQIVAAAFADRFQHSDDGAVVLLPSPAGVPWKAHLLQLEREAACCGQVLFVLYSDNAGSWRVQAVPPDEKRQFENRLPLPSAWRGLRDQQLSDTAGIPGCVFVHATGFIGANQSLEGAKRMAAAAVQLAAADKQQAA